jgi:hypothetical protein
MSPLPDRSRQAEPQTGMIRSAREAIRRLRRLFAELDYAQWRVLELQTDLVLTPETEHAIVRAQIDKLNALYEAEVDASARPR